MNKRYIFLVFIIATLVSTGAWATELWNGFTTEMNKDQVQARVRTLFSAAKLDKESKDERIRTYMGVEYPKPELYLGYSGISDTISGLGFYFLNDRLFFISFSIIQDNGFERFRTQNGQPTRTFVADVDNPFGAHRGTWYEWVQPSRIILATGYPHFFTVYFYDRQTVENGEREDPQSREEARRREEEALRKLVLGF